ncbi:hypothetical protein H7F50_01930 [Novosphingobium flavum]|uniref:hypothetical protein n=1 Tax=Novosphingobium aerophilum TaxID=2839843 RepID=UPI00163A95DF|nr:hypothetical protein [Novosphingobium aerophilum]MBC2660501.1 hypothetical protein [Novosphingobium aerophilum]
MTIPVTAEEADRADLEALVPMLLGAIAPTLFLVILLGMLFPRVSWAVLLLIPFMAAVVAPYWIAWRSGRPLRIGGTRVRGQARGRILVAGALSALILLFFTKPALWWLAEWLAQRLPQW